MTKAKQVSLGSNVVFQKVGSVVWFGVDTDQDGPQTKGSKGLDSKGKPKKPNEMVGSTGTYVVLPVTDGEGRELNAMLHLTRPMPVQALRKARAIRELAEEDTGVPLTGNPDPTYKDAVTDKLAEHGITYREALALAKQDGFAGVAELLAALED
jgi:hypothetical protein